MNKNRLGKMNGVHRVKLYKSGKMWIAMGITTLALGTTAFGVRANAQTTPTGNDVQTTQVEPAETSHAASQATQSTDGNVGANANQSNDTTSQSTSQSNQVATAKQASEPTQPVAAASQRDQTPVAASVQNTATDAQDQTPAAASVQSNATNAQDQTPASVQSTATDVQYQTAKNVAEQAYTTTGTPQTVTRVSSIVSGTFGTATWDFDDSTGTLAIHAGTLSGTGEAIPWNSLDSQILKITTDPGVIADATANNTRDSMLTIYNLFGDMPNVTDIDLTGLDTSKMNNMFGMFSRDYSLKTIEFNPSLFNTSNVFVTENMFYKDEALTSVTGTDASGNTKTLDDWNFSHVYDFQHMFASSGIQSLDLAKWNFLPRANVYDMLEATSKLWKLGLGPRVNLTQMQLPDVPQAGTPLPDGSKAPDGKGNIVPNSVGSLNGATGWESVGTGTPYDPEGSLNTAAQLASIYNGSGSGPTETYVWSQPMMNATKFIDVTTGNAVSDPILSGYNLVYGNPRNTSESGITPFIPVGYHYATGSELGQYVQPADSTLQTTASVPVVFYIAPDKTTTKLVVNFVDGDGNSVATPVTQSGETGTPFSYTAPTIAGYTLADPSHATTAGTYAGTVMTLTVKYNKVAGSTPVGNPGNTPTDGGTVTPPTNGQTTTNGNGGTTPGQTTDTNGNSTSGGSTEKPLVSITRPEVKTSVNHGSGVAGGTHQTSGTAQSGTSTSQAANSGVSTPATGNSQANKSLPQTNDSQSQIAAGIGLGLLTNLLALFGFKMKRREN